MTIRLILGDQLNYEHSWFQECSQDVIYFMAEMRQETGYVTHHIQKVVGFFLSMRNFADFLKEQGHKVIYYKLTDQDNEQTLEKNLEKIISDHKADKFEYLLPDEYRLDQQLEELCGELKIDTQTYDTEHFLTSRDELSQFFEGKKQFTMEYFYRYMRKKHQFLMLNEDQPEGGSWNFDKKNRNKWKGDPAIPPPLAFKRDVSKLLAEIRSTGITTIGNIDETCFPWPVNREDALAILDYFCEHLLSNFGTYQDAMDPNEAFLFHSRLSFALNTKMLSPGEVIHRVIDHWRDHKESINIAQVEGFVRQILGWREYMRGMYWKEMPEYKELNELDNRNSLPDFFWTGQTKMRCLQHAVQQSLDHAYAHHIQRLMITGNYALLTQCDPSEVDQWYLGIYMDAIEWVEITNTRGMSQFADGGKIATKPYVSSGSYINKMSNYCSGCHYNVKKKTGEDACPFNSLYWNFLDEKQQFFRENHRMNMMMSLLDKMDREQLAALKERARQIIDEPHAY